MATARAMPLATVRTSVRRMQREGEHMLTRLRKEAGILVTRGRAEVSRDLKRLERRVARVLNAGTRKHLIRLERRIAALEKEMPALRKQAV